MQGRRRRGEDLRKAEGPGSPQLHPCLCGARAAPGERRGEAIECVDLRRGQRTDRRGLWS